MKASPNKPIALVACLVLVSSPGLAKQSKKAAVDNTAYHKLQQQMQALEKEIDQGQFGYFGSSEKTRLQNELAHLKKIRKRADRYAQSLPPGCAEYRPSLNGRPQRTVMVVSEAGSHVVQVPPATQMARRTPRDYTPKDIYCRPRGSIPDPVLAKIIETENTRRSLEETRFTFDQRYQKRQLEQKLVALEKELLALGVASSIRVQVSDVEYVDPTVSGGVMVQPGTK